MLRDTRCENPILFSDMLPRERTLVAVVIVVVLLQSVNSLTCFTLRDLLSPLNGAIYMSHCFQVCPVAIEVSRLVLLSDFDVVSSFCKSHPLCLQPGPGSWARKLP